MNCSSNGKGYSDLNLVLSENGLQKVHVLQNCNQKKIFSEYPVWKPVNTNKRKNKRHKYQNYGEYFIHRLLHFAVYLNVFLQENLDCRPKNYKKVGTVVGVQGIKNEDLNLDWRETRKSMKIEN